MHIEEVDSIAGVDALARAWDGVHAVDRKASVFMTWAWQRGWLEVTPYPWTVLVARDRPGGDCLGFLPLSWRGSRTAFRLDQLREIHLAGEPAADYNGFVCRPDVESRVIPALAEYVRDEMPWERLRFHEVNDPRLDLFLAHMPGNGNMSIRDGVACPFIALPETFEGYLDDCLGYETRKSLRKRMRQVERDCRIERLDGSNADRLIDALMTLARGRQRANPDPHTMRLHAPLRRCAAAGTAWIVMIWQGMEPVAGMACFIDRHFNSLCTFLTSYDEKFASLSAGRVVNALCIRDAIEMGLKTLDFLRGAEPYKLQFGAAVRHNRTVWIERQSLQNHIRRRVGALRQKLNF